MYGLFFDQLTAFLGHDEIPPYYRVALYFYQAELKEFFYMIIDPTKTFGHPFLFPMLLSLFMKIFGTGSFVAKFFIFIFSSFSIYSMYKIANFVLKEVVLSIFFIVILLTTSNYFLNLPLLIGDTFLLTLTSFYLNYLFRGYYKHSIILAIIIGLSRESFLFFSFFLFFAEFVYQKAFKINDKQKLITISLSIIPIITWLVYNSLKTKQLMHTYAKFQDKSQGSYFDFTWSFFSQNFTDKMTTLFFNDLYIGFSLILTFCSFFFIKKFNDDQKRLIFYALFLNWGTIFVLSFYNVFLDRYVLYSSYLFVISAFIFIRKFITHQYLIYLILALPISLYSFHHPSYQEPFYGQNVNVSYDKTIISLDYLAKINELNKPILLCFPYSFFIFDEVGLYPPSRYNIKQYNHFNFYQIKNDFLYFICRAPISDDIYYRRYFENKEKMLLYRSGPYDDELEVWKIEL